MRVPVGVPGKGVCGQVQVGGGGGCPLTVREKGEGVGVGTGKGTSKSMRTHFSKPALEWGLKTTPPLLLNGLHKDEEVIAPPNLLK